MKMFRVVWKEKTPKQCVRCCVDANHDWREEATDYPLDTPERAKKAADNVWDQHDAKRRLISGVEVQEADVEWKEVWL